MLEAEPRRCPKCGGTPIIDHGDDGRYRVFCWWNSSCRYTTGWYETEEEAVAAWNNEWGYVSR